MHSQWWGCGCIHYWHVSNIDLKTPTVLSDDLWIIIFQQRNRHYSSWLWRQGCVGLWRCGQPLKKNWWSWSWNSCSWLEAYWHAALYLSHVQKVFLDPPCQWLGYEANWLIKYGNFTLFHLLSTPVPHRHSNIQHIWPCQEGHCYCCQSTEWQWIWKHSVR